MYALRQTLLCFVRVPYAFTRTQRRFLYINGRDVHEVMRLPSRCRPDLGTASCVDGLLSISIPLTPEHIESVPIAAVRSDELGCDISLLEALAPGLSAADISAQIRGHSLIVTSAKAPVGGQPLRIALRLPPSIELAAHLRAACENGLLTIGAGT